MRKVDGFRWRGKPLVVRKSKSLVARWRAIYLRGPELLTFSWLRAQSHQHETGRSGTRIRSAL